MSQVHRERTFEDSGKSFAAILNRQDDGLFSATVRLPDGSPRTVPAEHFASEDEAMEAAQSFAHELVGSCWIHTFSDGSRRERAGNGAPSTGDRPGHRALAGADAGAMA